MLEFLPSATGRTPQPTRDSLARRPPCIRSTIPSGSPEAGESAPSDRRVPLNSCARTALTNLPPPGDALAPLPPPRIPRHTGQIVQRRADGEQSIGATSESLSPALRAVGCSRVAKPAPHRGGRTRQSILFHSASAALAV